MNSRAKVSCVEPAERPLTVAISHAEVIALINYHVAQSRRIMKLTGKTLLEKRATSLLPSNREHIALIRVAKRQCDSHLARATDLSKMVEKKNASHPTAGDEQVNKLNVTEVPAIVGAKT